LKVSVVIPNRREQLAMLNQTVQSFRAAGADETIAVSDPRGKGPAWARNAGADLSTGDVIVWSDSHCTWEEGDFRAFCKRALDEDAILCAPTASMDHPKKFVAYGAKWGRHPEWPGYEIIMHGRERETAEVLYGSVYAVSRDTYKKLGGWPKTISWGYNEEAMSLAAKHHGVEIRMGIGCLILHKFKEKLPYAVRGLDPLVNRMIVHKQFSTDDEWSEHWAPLFMEHKQAWDRFERREKRLAAVKKMPDDLLP